MMWKKFESSTAGFTEIVTVLVWCVAVVPGVSLLIIRPSLHPFQNQLMNLMASIVFFIHICILILLHGSNAMEDINSYAVGFERMEQDDAQLAYYENKSLMEINQINQFRFKKIVQGLRSGSGKGNGWRDNGQSLAQVCVGTLSQKPFLCTSGSFNIICNGSSAREMVVNQSIAILTNGGKSTYFLVDHLGKKNCSSSYLTSGNITKFKTELQHRILKVPSDYATHVLKISVGSKDIGVKNGISVFDSSSTTTTLPYPVYDKVVSVLKEFLDGKYEKVGPIAPFKYCYNVSSGFDENPIPKIVVNINGILFELPLKNYIIDVQPQVKCIALLRGQDAQIFVIGRMMQENRVWEFTSFDKKLGVVASARLLFFLP